MSRAVAWLLSIGLAAEASAQGLSLTRLALGPDAIVTGKASHVVARAVVTAVLVDGPQQLATLRVLEPVVACADSSYRVLGWPTLGDEPAWVVGEEVVVALEEASPEVVTPALRGELGPARVWQTAGGEQGKLRARVAAAIEFVEAARALARGLREDSVAKRRASAREVLAHVASRASDAALARSAAADLR